MPAEAPNIVYASSRCFLATWRVYAFPVFGPRPFTASDASTMATALERHGRQCGLGRQIEISLIDESVPVPPAKVLAELNAAVPRCAPYFRCINAVHSGSGFRAGMVRGVFRTFRLLSRRALPMQVFRDAEECCAFLHGQLAPDELESSHEELLDVVAQVYAMARARRMLLPSSEPEKQPAV